MLYHHRKIKWVMHGKLKLNLGSHSADTLLNDMWGNISHPKSIVFKPGKRGFDINLRKRYNSHHAIIVSCSEASNKTSSTGLYSKNHKSIQIHNTQTMSPPRTTENNSHGWRNPLQFKLRAVVLYLISRIYCRKF